MPVPNMLLPTPEQDKFMNYVNGLIENMEKEIENVVISETKNADQWLENEGYQKLKAKAWPNKLIAKVDFVNGSLNNSINPSEIGK